MPRKWNRIQSIYGVLVTGLILTMGVGDSRADATRIFIRDGRWFFGDTLSHPGTPAEGLLINVRMVNATFEDINKPDFDSEKNLENFLQALPDYAAQGVNAFTFNLQGGFPGYEGVTNSALNPDGTLRPKYLERIQRVIRACDHLGCAVILGCYYQRQDQILRDETAIRRGVVNVVNWIKEQGFQNVVLEIANEFWHDGFDHAVLKEPAGEVELIRLAKKTDSELLVSASGLGDGSMPSEVAQAADFILIHFNGTPVDLIPSRIQALKKYRKPIVCNEDDKTGEEAVRALQACVRNGASWGYMNSRINQYVPFEFKGYADDPTLYAMFNKLTSR